MSAAHGHREILLLLLKNKADINFVNEHGNTALHYACFWGYQAIAEDLVAHGALVSVANKYGEIPLDKCSGTIAKKLHGKSFPPCLVMLAINLYYLTCLTEMAVDFGQDLKRVGFKDQSWLGLKTRSRDATLSRHKGINIQELSLHKKLAVTASGESWRGTWQGNDIVAKILAVRECTARISRDFNEEFPRLRIFSHPEHFAGHRLLQRPAEFDCHQPVHGARLTVQRPARSRWTCCRFGSGRSLRSRHCSWNGLFAFTRQATTQFYPIKQTCYGNVKTLSSTNPFHE